MKTVQRWRQKASHSRLEVQPLRRLDRRLFSVWNAGRPVCDSTQIGVTYVSHRGLSTASLSPGILMPCYCGSGTQERPDGTQYVLGCAAMQISQRRWNMVALSAVAHQSCCRVKHLCLKSKTHWLVLVLKRLMCVMKSKYHALGMNRPIKISTL